MSNFALYYELSNGDSHMLLIENETCDEAIKTFEDHLIEKHGDGCFDELDEYWVVSSSDEDDANFCAYFDEKYEFERYE